MSKKADRPDWEYGLGLRECKARSNPWAFIDGSLKAETWGLLADRQGCVLETLNRMSKKADRGEWNEEKGIFERQLETRSFCGCLQRG